jgi:hypothetical protein
MKKRNWIPLIIFALTVSSLACSWGFRRNSSQESEDPAATEELNIQNDALEDFQEPEDVGELQIAITEAQLTSLLFLQLERVAGGAVSDLQVYLRDGIIEATGRINQNGFLLPVRVVVDVGVDVIGRPVLSIASATAGPFSVPGDMVSDIEVAMNNAFRDEIESMAPNLQIETIVIEDGVMTLSGRKK